MICERKYNLVIEKNATVSYPTNHRQHKPTDVPSSLYMQRHFAIINQH
jgi:hypothetical protein